MLCSKYETFKSSFGLDLTQEAPENSALMKEYQNEKEKEVISLKTQGMQPYDSPMNYSKHNFKFTVLRRT